MTLAYFLAGMVILLLVSFFTILYQLFVTVYLKKFFFQLNLCPLTWLMEHFPKMPFKIVCRWLYQHFVLMLIFVFTLM